MTLTREQIRRAYIDACYKEIEALKPGNVHIFADGHRMNAQQFFDSAQVSSGPVTDPALSVGGRILAAVAATRSEVGTNTNLGILLLCIPLAQAAVESTSDLQSDLAKTLEMLDMADARNVFTAITLAQPGGLGTTSEHDVANEPDVPLLDAMRAASDRDMIARQYVTGFSDVFAGGLSAYSSAVGRSEPAMWPSIFVYLYFLSNFPDSHIVRKHGVTIAEETRLAAEKILARVIQVHDGKEREKILLAFDAQLKAKSINPGTSADLTVASLFASKLIWLLHNGEVNA
ncbi:triphosphoribosyl-dephospho-CoA synthase [Phyllobacterium sp. TAF24]|uniref:triphosphoribosyl-dephospho-CoA synthase n=1 Tax=Phyllobacterium sp. TAF24 TaxID=3233068 RepID=UPI003F990B9D